MFLWLHSSPSFSGLFLWPFVCVGGVLCFKIECHTIRPLGCEIVEQIRFRLDDRDRGGGGATKMLWRRSFGSSPLTSKEDVAAGGGGGCSGTGQTDWPALQANYAYLMDYDLIECCRSVVAGELSWDHSGLDQFATNNAVSSVDASSTVANASVNQSMTCAVGCQTDAQVTTAGNCSFSLP